MEFEQISKYEYLIDGKKDYDIELILSLFLNEGILFANSRDYYYNNKKEGHTIVLFVNCSDCFQWAYADAQDISWEEIEDLYEFYKRDKKWGSDKWCCKKRNEQPQPTVKRKMIEDGCWEAWMDKLNINQYYLRCLEQYKKKI